MPSLGDLFARVGLVGMAELTADLSSIPAQFENAAAKAEKAWKPLETLGSGLMGIGTSLSAAVTLPLVGIGAAAVKMSEELNMARLSFTTMLGSAEKAGEFLKELQGFAASTPFEFPDLVQAAKRMQAMGFEANQVIPTLRTIGDSVAALGGGKDMIDGVTLALGQMQAKGKVSAQEMNQLAERGIPAWGILAEAIGVKIPEAMKLAEKGAISAAVAVPAILEGMNQKFGGQMAKASETLTGVWSNFKDQVSMTLADVGNIIAPALKNLVELAMPLLQWAKDAVQWFSQLPEPIQTGALAFATFAAALGPIALALGAIITAVTTIGTAIAPIATVVGVTTGAFVAWAAAIPVVTAALVALGVWVYDNWEAITAVVAQAWDGIGEMWRAAWGPLYPWLVGIWDGIKKVTVAAWDGIANFLTGIWDGIKTAAATIWGGIVKTFQTFIEWAQKIPGVNKLMNLDDAWASAKKLEEQTKKTTTAVKAHADSHEKGSDKVKKFNIALGEQEHKLTAAEKAAKKAADARHEGLQREEQMLKKYKSTVEEYIEAASGLNKLTQELDKSNADLATTFAKAHEAMRQESLKTVEIIVPLTKRIPEGVQAAIQANKNLEEAYKTLGITSGAALSKHVSESQKAYETIRDSGKASVGDLNMAWVKFEEDRQAAARAAGEVIPREQEKALEKMKEQLSGGKGAAPWKEWSRQVSTIVTDLGKDIAKSLIGLFKGNPENDRLRQEESELRASLASREQEWQQYQVDVAQQLAELREKHASALAKEESDLQKALDERHTAYTEFVEETAEKIDEVREKHANAAASQIADLQESLRDREADYESYRSEVLSKIEDIRESHRESLQKELEDVQDNLRERAEQYADFVSDVETKLSRLSGNTEDDIQDTTRDSNRKIADRRKSFQREEQDTKAKIERLRRENKKGANEEIADLERALERKREDTEEYIRREQEDLRDAIEEKRRKQAEEEADLRESLARKQRDHAQYVEEQNKKAAEITATHNEAVTQQTSDLMEGLEERRVSLEQFRSETAAKIAEVTRSHAEAQAKEEADLLRSLEKRTADWEKYKNDAATKLQELHQRAAEALAADEKKLAESLAASRQEWENYKTDTVRKMEELRDKVITPIEAIGTAFKTMLGSVAEAVTRTFIEPASEAIGKFISGALTDLIGGKGFGGILDRVKDIGGAISGVFSGGANAAGSAAGSAGGVAGGAGGAAAGVAGGGLAATLGAIGSLGTMVSSIFGNFQNARQETTLNAMEESLRYIKIWTGEQSQSILWSTQKTAEFLGYLNTTADAIGQKLDNWLEPLKTSSANVDAAMGGLRTRLDEISHNSFWGSAAEKDNTTVLGEIREIMRSGGRQMQITINVSGASSPQATAAEINRQLRLQGAF